MKVHVAVKVSKFVKWRFFQETFNPPVPKYNGLGVSDTWQDLTRNITLSK